MKSHFVNYSSSALKETEFILSGEYFFFQQLGSHFGKLVAGEEFGFCLQDLFKVSGHILVFKDSWWISGPEAEVHGINHKAVSCNLLASVLLRLFQVPLTPLIISNPCCLNFILQFRDKTINFRCIYLDKRTLFLLW